MKKLFSILIVIYIMSITEVFGQTDKNMQELEMELIVTDEQKIILFGCFIAAVIGIFLYLARETILRKKTTYDSQDLDSKKDKTYEKYHSKWSDDYEELGARNNSKEEREFIFQSQNSNMPDYYKVLQISQNATTDEIKKQYRKLAKKVHPDKSKEEESSKIMAEINKAYEVLSNQELRKKYDMYRDKN